MPELAGWFGPYSPRALVPTSTPSSLQAAKEVQGQDCLEVMSSRLSFLEVMSSRSELFRSHVFKVRVV